ncbi:MAG TPA: hypothetical protein VD833_03085 [Vicinamibacterales bacterium]|nr:hypothetical protein [Vicinamibacterales bacterium]
MLVAVMSCLPALAADALAQAWVPGKGEGAVAVAVQSMHVKNHLSTTTPVDVGPIDTTVLLTDVTYGLTDRIAVDVALPLVTSKYSGARPHPGTDIDDGSYRTSATDLRFALRYNLTRNGAVVTPYVGTIVPSHDYAFYGHAAPGQRLREFQVGIYAAKLLDRGLPGLFVSGRYGFGFVEQVLDISHNRSVADLEVGYFFSQRFRAFAMTNAGYTHGGIDFPPNGLAGLPPEYRLNHDQIQKVHQLHLGGGAAYSITDAFDVFGSFSRLVAGRNGHALDRGITVGASWSFSLRKSPDAVTSSAPTRSRRAVSADGAQLPGRREGSLVRCICQKSGA